MNAQDPLLFFTETHMHIPEFMPGIQPDWVEILFFGKSKGWATIEDAQRYVRGEISEYELFQTLRNKLPAHCIRKSQLDTAKYN